LLQATAELRESARGVHPVVLSQSRPEGALGSLADHAAVPVRGTAESSPDASLPLTPDLASRPVQANGPAGDWAA